MKITQTGETEEDVIHETAAATVQMLFSKKMVILLATSPSEIFSAITAAWS